MKHSLASRLVLESVDDRVVPATYGVAFDNLPEPPYAAAIVRHASFDLAELAERPMLPSAAGAPPRAVLGGARLEPDALRENIEQLRSILDERILVGTPDRLVAAGTGATPLPPPFVGSPGEAPVPFEVVARRILIRLRGGPGGLAPGADDQPEAHGGTLPAVAATEALRQPAAEAPSRVDVAREQAASPMTVMVADSGSHIESVSEPTPVVELVDPPAERPMPVEVVEETLVEAPALDPLFGLLPVDVSAVGREAQALLDHVAALQVVDVAEWLGTERHAWLAGVVAATGGTVQAIRMYRTRGRAAHDAPSTHFVLGRWEGDVGTDR